jgi:DNA-binding NarL/FixJ family response regulator/tetratricopeptide (TPR) repeat protein
MGRVRDPFLGRQMELDLLRGELEEARKGDSSFVIVSGEAGIGKTRLLEELAVIADNDGFLTLRGRGSEFDSERPFGLYADALDAYLASLGSQDLERLETDRLGALAAVFPSLHQLDQAVEYPASVTERFRAHHAVRDLLERLAARRPLLLILDDIHWADGASLELTSYLLRNPPQGEIVVAIALRFGQGGPAVARSIGASYGRPNVVTIDLQPLDVESVTDLVADAGDIDLDELLRLSGGNPFYALQLARSGLDYAVVDEGGLEVPAAVAATISVELASLTPLGRSVAEAASTVGDPFDLDLAVAASDRPEQEVLEAIDMLLARDLVRETDVPRRFQFRHPVVHRAVYGGCSPSVKVSCNRRVATALQKRGVPATTVAPHVEQSARHGDMQAVAILRRAAREAAQKAPTSSVRWLTAALRILPGDAPTEERAEILTELAASQGALGHFADAHETLEECLAIDDRGGEAVGTVVRCAEMEQLLGHHAESRTRLEKAYDGLADRVSTSAVSLLIALTAASLYLSDHDRMLQWGERAVDAAKSLDDPALFAAALAAHTMGAAFAGRFEVGLDLHERCTRLIDSLPDDVIVSRLDALSNLAAAETYLDHNVSGCEHGERCLRLARVYGQTHVLPILTPILGTSLALTGRMERSAEILDDAIEAARLVGDAQGLSMNLFNRALAATMAGDLETALRTGAESVELARSIDNGVITAFAGAIHAQTLLELGDALAARELLLESVGGEEIPLLAGGWRAHFLEALTRCHLALGDLEFARQTVARLTDEAVEHGPGLTALMADRAGAELALIEGNADRAANLARSAVAAAEQIGASAHVAPSRALLGRALVASGAMNDAIAELETAAAEFDTQGAVRFRDQVESELRRLGHSTTYRRSAPGQGDTFGVDSLTGRELEVAGLVLDRRTNREIAEELFLSTKTVETHMRHIFDKLGVSSRVEVARALERSRQT